MTTTVEQVKVFRRRLSFRCSRCHGVALAQAEWRDRENSTIACGICGQKYVLSAGRARGANDAEYREQVRALALANQLDLPTATSVLEEIMPLAQAMALRRPPAQPVPAPTRPRRPWLPATVACVAVAVAIALFFMRPRPGPEPAFETPVPTPAIAMVVAPQTASTSVPVRRESPVVGWRDDAGTLTEIAGPDPASVLAGFCREVPGFEPVNVQDAFPPNPGTRIGVVHRTMGEPGTLNVPIRRDPRTGRWFIGDRRSAIRLSSARPDTGSTSNPARSTPGGG